MNLEARLRAFAAFVRHRSFSAAGAELRISQPAVSKHIADLERALGLKLVERARRDGALTSSGEFIANHVLRAEALLAQAARGAAELRTSGTGSLTIVASWLTGTYLLPKVMAEFKHLHPGVRLSLQLGTAKQAVEWLRSHQAELGFVADAGGGPEVEAEPLLNNELTIVARPNLIPKRVTRESLEALTWISREEGSATRSVSERALTNLGIVARKRLELPSYEAVLWALKNGYGVSAISRYVIDDDVRSGALAIIPVRGWHVRTVISVLRARDVLLTPSADKFQALARQRFAEITRDRRRRGRRS
jgi:DNA-binding transcriptional LysR family regulator